MANLVMSGGPNIIAVTNPLRSFLGLTSGVSSVFELVVMSVDGTSVEASLSGAAPSSPADILREEIRNRSLRPLSEHWLKRGDDMAICGCTVLMLAGESVGMVNA